MDELYREFLLDHYKNPQNKDIILDADIHFMQNNPTCGDSIEIFMKLKRNRGNDGVLSDTVEDFKFQGTGCVISMASASMLSVELKEKTLAQIKEMGSDEILELIKLQLTPTRIKCAMLALDAARKGIEEYEKKFKK